MQLCLAKNKGLYLSNISAAERFASDFNTRSSVRVWLAAGGVWGKTWQNLGGFLPCGKHLHACHPPPAREQEPSGAGALDVAWEEEEGSCVGV